MQTLSRLQPMRVALFGTSADPPHLGHQSILTWLSQEFDQVAVWAADNPYKTHQAPLRDRAQMLQLLIDSLPTQGQPGAAKVAVCQTLSDRYSVHSIARAREIWPHARFSLVVGADLISQLPSWYKAQDIFAQVEILVFPRPGYDIEGPALSTLQQQAKVVIAHPPSQHDIASSRYRSRECRDSPREFPDPLPPVIRDYIHQHHLYPCLQTTPAKISTPQPHR